MKPKLTKVTYRYAPFQVEVHIIQIEENSIGVVHKVGWFGFSLKENIFQTTIEVGKAQVKQGPLLFLQCRVGCVGGGGKHEDFV